MRLKYNRMSFGRKEKRITFVHLNKPWKLGLAGMVTSPMFQENIAVVIDDTPFEESDYDYACLACDKHGRSPRIMMNSFVFYDIKRGSLEARTILFHELGHYHNKDISEGKCSGHDTREALATSGSVSPAELCADAFASDYLGKDKVIMGLAALKERILNDYANYEEVCYAATIQELDSRIAALTTNNTTRGGNV